jgi:chaperonin GroEL (HSP60 family)
MFASSSGLLKDLILAGATDAVASERSLRAVDAALGALRAAKAGGKPLTKAEEARETARVLGGGGAAAGAVAAKEAAATAASLAFLEAPAERLAQARAARSIVELRQLWDSAGSSSGAAAAAASTTSTTGGGGAEARITEMREARAARSTDKVVVECFSEGGKLRARVVSAGYDPAKNVQFPRAIRAAGKRFVVDTVVDAGSFYRVKGNIEEE